MNPKPASMFAALLQDRREVLTAASTSGNLNGLVGHFGFSLLMEGTSQTCADFRE